MSGDAGQQQQAVQDGGVQQGGEQQGGQGQQFGSPDKGFPENTPVADMNPEQRANYYKHQNRQTDNKLAAFKGVTPEQVAQLQQENETLRNEKLSADEKALNAATKKAAEEARAAADAEWRPKYQASELKGLAGQVLKGEQLKSFMAVTDPAKFADENGVIDEDKVMGHLTAIFGTGGQDQQQGHNNGHQQRSWGQHSGGTGVPARPGDAGKAAAAQRFGKTKTP